jgi:hypothetical protein
MKLVVLFSAILAVTSVRFKSKHDGPTLMYPRNGEFIDLTAKPIIVDDN